MATFNISSNEDFIDIILTPSSPSDILPCPNSPYQTIDFEFQNPNDPIFNHDDELIYKGKLLPLFVPPFCQTGQETLHGLKPIVEEDEENDLYYSITFHVTSSKEETTLDETSCPDNVPIYEVKESVNTDPSKKPSWVKIVKFVVVQKMKAMKSWFSFKPMCSGGFCDKISFDEQSEGSFIITKRCSSMPSTISSSSSIASSCTFDIDIAHEARFLRSSSDDDDDETECSSVDAAVAYCKKSRKILNPSLGYDFENMLVWM